MSTSLTLFFCYALGCIPWGVLIGKMYGVDVRQQGSGNIGATNVARVVGKKAGLITLLLDVLKGVLAVWLGGQFIDPALCALFVVAGHCLSLPGFLKGGKGVATSIGVIIMLSPPIAGLVFLTFVGVFLLTKTVAKASLIAACLTPCFALLQFSETDPARYYALLAISMIVITKHKDNIIRIFDGTEPKTEFKKKS